MTAATAAGPRDWGVYDAPALRDALSVSRGGHAREMLMRVDGLHCVNCVRNLERALAPLTDKVQVRLATGTAELQWDERNSRISQLFAAVESAGYRPSAITEQRDLRDEAAQRRSLLLRLGVAGILGMQVMMLAATQYQADADIEPALQTLMRYAQWMMSTPVLLYSGWPFLVGAGAGLRRRQFNMDVPVSVAILLAYGASVANLLAGSGHVYFDSVTMFVFLLLLARWFEGGGRAEAARRLRELAGAQPLSALREEPHQLREVPAHELRQDDVLVLPPGAVLAADGQLLSAHGEFDESLLTGESQAASRREGEAVYAGAVNLGHAPLRVRVSAANQGTVLSHINRLMHRAQAQRPRVQQLADRIAGWVVAAVLLTAAAGFAWWYPQDPQRAFNVALAVLVVTCPCALSLATPVVLAAAASRLARSGLLLTRADALLQLPQIDRVCFDKTGTLTTGRMRLDRVETEPGEDRQRMLQIATALERGIRHPVATAFAQETSPLVAEELETLPGEGVRGRVDGHDYRLIADPLPSAADGLTWIALRRGPQRLARFGLSQALRPEAAAVVRRLRELHLQVSILSGDSGDCVAQTAARLGITEHRAELRPDDKLAWLLAQRRQGHRVWMIGDGINDAPVLAAANVSTSLASASALAQSQADLLIMGESLAPLSEALAVARKAQRLVHQNLAWAVAYNLVAVPLALSGNVTPWLAALGMGASSVTVVLNALRVARHRAAPAPAPAATATATASVAMESIA